MGGVDLVLSIVCDRSTAERRGEPPPHTHTLRHTDVQTHANTELPLALSTNTLHLFLTAQLWLLFTCTLFVGNSCTYSFKIQPEK